MDGPLYWVLIETGGNQRYIFGSNRLRHVVGASQLVHEVGTQWVPDALGGSEDTLVMAASGKALLAVPSEETGREVIKKVTTRALDEAPGLMVTGVVGPPFDPSAASDSAEGFETARIATYERHAEVRATRPDPALRDQVFPWHQLCRESGLPAAGEELYGPDESSPASAGVLARSDARRRAKERMRLLLGDREFLIPSHLDELRHSGWIAVLHADGNDVGRLFRRFATYVAQANEGRLDWLTYRDWQGAVAGELDTATQEAVTRAVESIPGNRAWLTGRFLPIVVGGDDVTVACDAAIAVDFVREFAPAFEDSTRRQPNLSRVALAATGRDHLTASAGIAVVKLHHPFARAYDLAEDLTTSAKRFTDADGRKLGAFDFHIAHTSVLCDLEQSREHLPGEPPIARHAGPYLLVEPYPPTLAERGVNQLDTIMSWMGPRGWLSGTQAHALRDAADRSLDEYRHQLELTLRDAPDADAGQARRLLDVTGEEAGQPFLRLFDALHLRGLRLAETSHPDPETAAIGGGTR